MENRNIYKMDDILIVISYLMLLPTAFIAWPWLRTLQEMTDLNAFLSSAPSILGSRLTSVIFYAVGIICSQLVGRVIRHGEKQSLKILDALEYSRKSTIDQLAMSTGMSISRTRTLVKKLSKIVAIRIQLEGENVSMGRRKSVSEKSFYTQTYSPDKATEPHSESSPVMNAGEKGLSPEVQAIMRDKSLGAIQKLKKLQELGQNHPELIVPGLHDSPKISEEAARAANSGQNETIPLKRSQIILFIILLISPLWPIALIGAIAYVSKNKNKFIMDHKQE